MLTFYTYSPQAEYTCTTSGAVFHYPAKKHFLEGHHTPNWTADWSSWMTKKWRLRRGFFYWINNIKIHMVSYAIPKTRWMRNPKRRCIKDRHMTYLIPFDSSSFALSSFLISLSLIRFFCCNLCVFFLKYLLFFYRERGRPFSATHTLRILLQQIWNKAWDDS